MFQVTVAHWCSPTLSWGQRVLGSTEILSFRGLYGGGRCVGQLQIAYVYLIYVHLALPQTLHWAVPGICYGTVPQILYAHPTPKPFLHHCCSYWPLNQISWLEYVDSVYFMRSAQKLGDFTYYGGYKSESVCLSGYITEVVYLTADSH